MERLALVGHCVHFPMAADKFDRIAGCIVGGAVGDSYGSPFEGSALPFKLPADPQWVLSDDTQLTVATCEAIINNDGVVVPARIAETFAIWHRESRVTGMGASTFKALSELIHGGHWALVGRRGEYAAGNGAAMRIAPLAFCLDPGNSDARRLIRDVSYITHHHEEAYIGALAIVVAVRAAWSDGWQGTPNLLELVADSLPDSKVRDRLVSLAGLRMAHMSEIAAQFGNSGYVVESVPLALAGAERVTELGFKGLMEELIGAGGDADTIASMAGQVTGTLLGRNHLPAELVKRLPELTMIEDIAERFAQVVIEAQA